MDQEIGVTISECFSSLPDPRMENKVHHLLIDIITITICAVICGANNWGEIETYGRSKYEWLKTFLELPKGIPSHDTLGRVFSLISTQELEKCFLTWVNSISRTVNEIIAIDGKQLRRSYDSSTDKAAIHMVSAWASENGMVLGQVKTDEKSNEITAVPKLLELLELKGCIVTIDAMGCQKQIAKQIHQQEADYVLALKGNQESLYDEVFDLFENALEKNFEGMNWDYHETSERNHGRTEIRKYWTISDLDSLSGIDGWENMNSVGMVESVCHRNDVVGTEFRFYISSLEGDAKVFAHAVRKHWGIENSLHWVLDVVFREDESRIRKGNSPENLAIMRHLAVNLLKNEKSVKGGIQMKRLRAGWDNDFLLKVIAGNN